MEILLLNDIIIIFGLSIFILLVCNLLHIPAVVGFLLTGVFVGPFGLGLINAVHEVEILAEIGIVLLLFTIGIEFSFEKMLRIKKSILLGGSLQVFLTLGITFLLVKQFGKSTGESIFIGFLISLSSTAIVLKIIQERAEVDSPQGNTILGVLIFQDIIIVPMILVTPMLAGVNGGTNESAYILIIKGISIIGLIIIGTKFIVPNILYQITKTKSQELFILSVVTICLAVALITHKLGLSLALGAFLAGLIISESEYSHRALGNILPFKDVFTTFFFVSIGMLLDVGFLIQQFGIILIISVGIITLKAVIAAVTTIILGFPLRTSILVGLGLGQVGEFSFILSRAGIEHGLLTENMYQIFLSGSVLSIAATPFLIAASPGLANAILKIPFPQKLKAGFFPVSESKTIKKEDHLILIGFGVTGRNVARVAKITGIPYVIIEMNPQTVKSEQALGEPICYGDSTQEIVLKYANVEKARNVVIAINDPIAVRRITEVARRLNPKVYLIVRTRYLQEMKLLYELGGDEVIPEEFETSIEIFTRVLTNYLIPRNEIEKLVSSIRKDGYEMFRNLSEVSTSFEDLKLQLPDIEIKTLRVSEKSYLVDKSLIQLNLRKKYGVTVLAIRRNSNILSNPDADTILLLNDDIFIIGSPYAVAETVCLSQNIENQDATCSKINL